MRDRCTMLWKKIQYRVPYDMSDRRWLIAMYTMSFSILAFFVFGIFSYYGKTLIGGTDGMSQVAAFMQYNGKYYRQLLAGILQGNFEIPMWDMSIGLGMNVMEVLYFRPIYILCSMIFYHNISMGVIVYDIICMYLIGLTFALYCEHLHCQKWTTLIGALMYTFNGYLLNYCLMQHTFLELFFLLPLTLWGVDRIYAKKKYGMFMGTVFYLALTNFLNLYTVSIVLAVYLSVKYWGCKKERSLGGFLRYLWKPILSYVISVLLAAVSLLPKLYMALTSGRVGNSELGIGILYEGRYYLKLIQGFIEPKEIGMHGYLGMPGIALIALLALYLRKGYVGVKKRLQIEGILLMFAMIFPIATYVFNGFSGINHRWFFFINFYLAVVTATMLPGAFLLPIQKKRALAWGTLTYVTLYLLISVWQKSDIYISIVFIVFYLMLILSKGIMKYSLKKGMICSMVCIELAALTYHSYSPMESGMMKLFRNSSDIDEKISIQSSAMLKNIDDDHVYRTKIMAENYENKMEEANAGLRTGSYTFDGYFSYTYGSIMDAVQEWQINKGYAPFNIMDFDSRTTLYMLGGVKYIAKYADGEEKEPWGYEVIKEETVIQGGEEKKVQLLRNKYELPLIYSYAKIIPETDYKKMASYEKEEAMLQGLVIDKKKSSDLATVTPEFDDTVILDTKEIKRQIQEQTGDTGLVELTTKGIENKQSSTTLTFEIPEKYKNSELYLCVKGIRYIPKNPGVYKDVLLGDQSSRYDERVFDERYRNYGRANPTAILRVKYGSNVKKSMIWGANSQYDTGARDIEINMGYYDKSQKKFYLTLEALGEYQFSEIEVVTHSMDNVEKYYSERKKYAAEKVQIRGNQVTGEIKVKDKSMACIAIPYHKGWSATVNGKKVNIVKANGMYMAVPLEVGYNKIVLSYTIPGLKYGMMISGLALVVLIFWEKIRKYKRKQVRKYKRKKVRKKVR